MATITYDFSTGYQGWSFSDASTSPTAFTTRSYDSVSQCISVRLVDVGPVNALRAIGINYLSALAIPFEVGDSVNFDYSAPADGKTLTKTIEVIYADSTSELTSLSSTTAGTITVTATVNKTVERINAYFVRQCAAGRCPVDTTICMEEIRINTATPYTPTAGKLKSPKKAIDDMGNGGGVPGGEGGGAGGNIADISADGLYVYIAAFNDLGFPTLIKILATLTADGSVVFDPIAGGRIGVQCGQLNASNVYIAGQFGGTDTVELSDDAGASFSVIDDATFGAIRTFQVGPGDDNRIMVFDGDNGDIIETRDGGTTWTAINAAVTPLINSIARFDINPEEIVAGNQGGANNSINYSPNSGVNLEDYQTGVYPNADATKVAVK